MSAANALPYFLAIQATRGVLLGMVSALGEEIGWRGFLVPGLSKQMSFTKVGLLSGIIWAMWHWPGILFTDYNAGTNAPTRLRASP